MLSNNETRVIPYPGDCKQFTFKLLNMNMFVEYCSSSKATPSPRFAVVVDQ